MPVDERFVLNNVFGQLEAIVGILGRFRPIPACDLAGSAWLWDHSRPGAGGHQGPRVGLAGLLLGPCAHVCDDHLTGSHSGFAFAYTIRGALHFCEEVPGSP